ncbi:hypothetical protein ACJ72_06883 [Emergomyces africanus]|uniref:3-beta hydroxysteroid dehydrogenase/isomerase domain-containing protein n=1 Tax=Emergomyces africanus TaxID=1955775 RepID=A0A1B7NQA9_9EURO|nr:hypothetical protein ACJ72_06883 [Emergomyces africanus]
MATPKTIELGSVLVTGGCGFLGSHVVDQLLNFPSEAGRGEKGQMLQSPVRKPTGELDTRFAVPRLAGRYPTYKNTKVSVLDLRTAHNRYPGADYYEADIMSTEQLLEVFRKVKPDVVIHTVSPPPMQSAPELLYRINVDGTKNLLEVAGGLKGEWGGVCKAFVYTSSSSVVHDCHSDLILADERWPLITGKMQYEYYTEDEG